MPWIRRKLRDNVVFVKVAADGQLAADKSGRVDVVYKLGSDAKIYRASARNLEPTGNAADEEPFEVDGPEPGSTSKASEGATVASTADIPKDAIIIWTDGACIGNPGPMGIGAVIIDGEKRQELSEYLGHGTNNIAELTAILRALEQVPASDRGRPVAVHSDSSYSIGLLTKGWKAKANQELVAKLRALAATFTKLQLVKVKGHAGIEENERCDELAGLAIEEGATGPT